MMVYDVLQAWAVSLCRMRWKQSAARLIRPGGVGLFLSSCSLLQPLDAAASILDGGLLGAQDQTYVARAMVVTAAVCFTGLAVVRHWNLGACRASPICESLPTCLPFPVPAENLPKFSMLS